MKEELQQKLFKRYPRLFAERFKPMTETCMCWGCDVGDGWYNLLDSLCGCIQAYIDNPDSVPKYPLICRILGRSTILWDLAKWCLPKAWFFGLVAYHRPTKTKYHKKQVVFSQVKEKFGCLRVYYYGGDDYIDGLVRMAESMSARTCEECGCPGKIYGPGWYTALCAKHAADRGKTTIRDRGGL